jgi:phenylpropionate dioxygenase-like ring-hydroxylating dioxygenase large terminal subunit
MSSYVMNAWYQAGWSDEVSGGMLSRILLQQRLVFWRRSDGRIVAMDDRCPHRFAPLSRGRRADDQVTCGYHGLTFNAEGRCVHNPFSARIPPRARVRSYPTAERDSILWFWPGDPERADEALLPDFSVLRPTPTHQTRTGYTHVKAHYEVGTDNLLDLSHIETVHAGTFGGQGIIYKGELQLHEDGRYLNVNWWMPNLPLRQIRPDTSSDAPFDRWLDMRWHAPSCMRLHVGLEPHGRASGEASREDMPGHFMSHILTPETETTSHYFWASSEPRDAPQASGAMLQEAFDREDKPMLEAVQQNMGGVDLWAQKPVILSVDAGAIRARRILADLIQQESQAKAPLK